MAYGTPQDRDEILPYYTDIRRGHPPTNEQLADLTARYEAIGGLSPLARLTKDQCNALQNALNTIEPNKFVVRLGLKHAFPMIEETTTSFINDGIDLLVGLVMAPHYSSYSIGQYLNRLKAVAEPYAVNVLGIRSWATNDAYIDFLSADLSQRLARAPEKTKVLFTAHSLPQRIIDAGDPYAQELRCTATAVANRVGLSEWTQWAIAWQSAGRTPEPWIGPDVLSVIDQLSSSGEADGVIISACGFVADHLEVLYDLDIEAKQRANRYGLYFDRTACVNTDRTVMSSLADLVVNTVNEQVVQ